MPQGQSNAITHLQGYEIVQLRDIDEAALRLDAGKVQKILQVVTDMKDQNLKINIKCSIF
jgi:hypothetical protein